MRGYARMPIGSIPLTHLKREYDEDGEPIGYACRTGVDLLKNPDHRAVYGRLQDKFSTGDAKIALGKASQATETFLKACMGAKIIEQVSRGRWIKITQPDGNKVYLMAA